MTAAILMPIGGTPCRHRDRALAWIIDHYERQHSHWPLWLGRSGEPWSKGVAVADAFQRTTADVLILADADSYVQPDILSDAVARCELGQPWVVPHHQVFRLSQDETERVYAGAEPDLANLARPSYTGPPGGGITVLRREAYETVGGIDPRFYGWGGEDLALGWTLLALCGLPVRLTGRLVHLWHPHPAPDLRGSPESEHLVARYKAFRRAPDSIRVLIEERHEPVWTPAAHGDGHPG